MSGEYLIGITPPQPPSLDAHWFLFRGHELLVVERDGKAALARPPELPPEAHYLGSLDGRPCFAARVPEGGGPQGAVALGLRSVFGALPEPSFRIAGQAIQVLEWDRTHRFCGACGVPTEPVGGERARRCPSCRLTFYPRISPAVIVLVHRGEEAVLGRNKRFVRNFYSTLAGFVEAGESLEETLAREIREEVGLEIKDPRYFGSQPWPFPNSLMLGFTAQWASGEIRVDDTELADARWFRHDALPDIPPPGPIARQLIDWWIGRCRAGNG